MTLTSTVPSGRARSAGSAIEAEHLVKRFGDLTAVDDVSFTVPQGSVLGLLGPNGAGKTTTVRMMTTLSEPTSGTARVAGHDVVRDPEAVRRSMGLTGQAATVDELLTGRENLRLMGSLYGLPKAAIRRLSDELLERFSLTDAGDKIIKDYSGGMRRRLDLAVSLIATPPVLFLDEPTTGLDPRSRVELWEVLRGLVRDGTTLLLTTQYLEEADQLADRIVVIDHGRIIAQGTPLELKDQSGKAAIVLTVSHVDQLEAARPAPPAGFTVLFNGKDLSGWRGRPGGGGVFSPYVEGKFTLPTDPVPWAGVVLMVLAVIMLFEAIRVIATLGGSPPQPEFEWKPATV